ncbi:MAG: MATE family multidrug resistance protein [Paracoccaceae bacterium]|jgi:MATE family multidrug resistance protein
MPTNQTRSYAWHMGATLKLGLPLVGGHLAQFAITLTDTAMIGWYDVTSLAGMILGSTLFFVVFLVGSGFASAAMPLVAETSASDQENKVRRIVVATLWLSMVFALVMIPLMLLSDDLFRALGQEPENAGLAQVYLQIAAWGIFPALIVMVLRAYLSAMETAQVIFWTTLLMAVANAGLNWVLIFGNLGAPELGVRGAAIASVITHSISIPFLVIYATRKFRHHRVLSGIWDYNLEVGGKVFRLGLPIGLTSLAEMGMFSVGTLMMGWVGTISLTAHAIAQLVSATTFMIHLGVSQAATVRVGRALGLKDMASLRDGAIAAMLIAYIWVGITMFVLIVYPDPLISLFMAPDESAREMVIAAASTFLFVAAIFQLADASQLMGLSLLRGLQDTRVPLILAVLSYWVVGVPASYVLAFALDLGGAGIWWGQVVGLSVAAVLLQIRFWRVILPTQTKSVPTATGSVDAVGPGTQPMQGFGKVSGAEVDSIQGE